MSLASASDSGPYICNCFYILIEDTLKPGLVFASSPQTRHAREMQALSAVAVAIHKAVREVTQIQGLQILGNAWARPNSTTAKLDAKIGSAPVDWEFAKSAYLEAFPEAGKMPDLPLWYLSIDWLKYTDNRVKFGHKEIWQAAQ